MAPYAPAAPTKRRPAWRVVGVVIAAFAVLSGSAFAYLAFTAPDGAATPEEAVQHLFDAIDKEDAIGVLEALPPSERDVLKEPIVEIINELQRLGILKQFELNDVPGEDLKIDGLTLATENIGANEDVKLVKVTGGTISGTSVPSEVPIGDTLRKIVEEDFGETIEVPQTSFSESLGNGTIRMVTVKEKGGWHVSLYYSMAEAIRGDNAPPPVLGNGPKPVGSTTPEGALKDLVAGAIDLDVERVIAMLPPDEMRAVYDYAPLFLPDAKEDVAKAKEDGYTAKVNRLDTRVDGEGEVRKVFVTGFDVELGDGRNKVHATFDGSCVVYDETSARYSSSSGSSGSSGSSDVTHGEMCTNRPSSITRHGTSTTNTLDLGKFNGLSGDFGVVVVEREGRWYVSPTRTFFDSMLTALRKVSREDIERWGKQLADFSGASPAYRTCERENPYPSSSSGSSSSSYDRANYQRRKALNDCLKKAGIEPQFSYNDPCYAAYEALDDDAPEREWEDADDAVRECRDRSYGSSGTTPPGTAYRGGTIPRYPGSSGTSIPRTQTRPGTTTRPTPSATVPAVDDGPEATG